MIETFLSEPMPNSVFYSMFAVRAVLGFILGMHSLIVATVAPSSPKRTFAIWLGLHALGVTAVDGAFFALAFWLGLATLTGVGIIIFLPGTIAVVGCLMAWVQMVQEEEL